MPDFGQELSSINFGSIIGGSLNAVVEAQCQSANTTVDFIRNVGFQPGTNGGLGAPIYVSFQYDKETLPAQPATKASYHIEVAAGGTGYKNDIPLIISSGATVLDCTPTIVNGTITAVSLNTPCNLSETVNLTVKEAADTAKKQTAEGKDAQLRFVVTPAAGAQPAQFERMTLQVPVLTMLPIPFIKVAEATIDFNVKINSVTTSQSKESSSYGGKLDVTTSFSIWRFKTTAKLNATLSNQKSSSNSENVKRDYSLNIHIKAVQDDIPEGTSRLLDILHDSITARPTAAVSTT